jgi:hypothetical protein
MTNAIAAEVERIGNRQIYEANLPSQRFKFPITRTDLSDNTTIVEPYRNY